MLVSLLSVNFLEIKDATAKHIKAKNNFSNPESFHHFLIPASNSSSFQLKGSLLQDSRMPKSPLKFP